MLNNDEKEEVRRMIDVHTKEISGPLPDMWWMGSGIVVEGVQDRNEGRIKVYCPELSPLQTGVLDREPTEETVEIKGTDELPQKPVTVKLTDNLRCDYIEDPHNASVPDIVPGEQVLVYRHRGDDRFFWLSYRNDNHLRQTEHFRLSMMNKNHQDKETEDETYFFEVDTKFQKGIRMKTSSARGEKYVYLWEIDTESGSYVLKDDDGNYIKLTSDTPAIEIENREGTYVKITGQNISANAPANIQAEAGSQVNAKAGSAAVVAAPSIKLDGNVEISGTLNTGGAASFPSHGPPD